MTDPLNKIFLTLGEIKADQESMKKDVAEIKEGVADYKRTKNRIIGICVGISAAVGGGLSALLNKLGIHI